MNSNGHCLSLSQACECSGIKEVESHLPPVSAPKTDLSETLTSDHFFLWSTFSPETTSHFTFLTQNEKLLQINKCYSYAHSYMYVVYACTDTYSVKNSSSVCNQTPVSVQICCQIFTGL